MASVVLGSRRRQNTARSSRYLVLGAVTASKAWGRRAIRGLLAARRGGEEADLVGDRQIGTVAGCGRGDGMEGAAGSEMTESEEEFGWVLRERVSGVGHRHGADTI